MDKEVLRREVRYAIHLPKNKDRDDCHYVKEQVYYTDGTSSPRTFLTANYQRQVWVTKESFRNHVDKKEFEVRDRLHEQKCTQSDINRTVANMLGQPHLASSPDLVKGSPFVYGMDQTSTSLIKLKSLLKNNFIQSPYTVAVMDIETSTDEKNREIYVNTVAMAGKAHTAISKKFLANSPGIIDRIQAALAKYLPKYVGALDWQITFHDDEVDLLKAVFKTANDWAPDFLAFWNVNFDMKVILGRLKKFNVNPIDVICDTSIPRQYRMCRYKEGITSKSAASGKHKPINPSLQWHNLFSTSKFYVIDAMCVYRQIRMAKQEEPSYSLNAILQKVLGSRKLSFEEAEQHKGAKWHIFMCENYPIEYLIYNLYDCLGVLELDNETKDLANSLPSGAGMTDFAKFNSNPKKIVDALFLFGLERGMVVGTVGPVEYEPVVVTKQKGSVDDDDYDDDDDEEEEFQALGLKGWIQLLPQNHLLADGLKCLEEYPNVSTSARGAVGDIDATAAYPTATMVSNASKATCVNEIIHIDGVTEETFREQNLSVCLGGVNSLEYFNVMFSMPAIDSDEMDDEISKVLAEMV